eukprot:6017271-Lingulodinium_polyedra.AAC.1
MERSLVSASLAQSAAPSGLGYSGTRSSMLHIEALDWPPLCNRLAYTRLDPTVDYARLDYIQHQTNLD